MNHRWPEWLRFREQRMIWGGAAGLVLLVGIGFWAGRPELPALPDLSAEAALPPSTRKAGTSSSAEPAATMTVGFFLEVSPASWAALFGVRPPSPTRDQREASPTIATVSRPADKLATATVVASAPAAPPASAAVASLPPPAPPPPDLHSLGYRVRGIITGDRETAAAFVWDPRSNREVLVRFIATNSFQLTRVADREIELITPLGTGVLRLPAETIRPNQGPVSVAAGTSPAGGANQGSLGGNPPVVSSPAGGAAETVLPPNQSHRILGEQVMNLLHSGAWRAFQEQGQWVVAVDRLPPDSPLLTWGVQPGDRILAVGERGFHHPSDIPKQVGALGEAAHRLVVMRQGKLLSLDLQTGRPSPAGADSAPRSNDPGGGPRPPLRPAPGPPPFAAPGGRPPRPTPPLPPAPQPTGIGGWRGPSSEPGGAGRR